MVLGPLIALAASIGWGSVDFITGRFSRRLPVLAVVALTQLMGFVTLGAVGIVQGFPHRHVGELLTFGLLAGVTAAGAATALNLALAAGTMSLVAPLSGLSALVPIAVGLAQGERLSALRAGGMVLVLVALPIAVREPRAGGPGAVTGVDLPVVLIATLMIGATLALLSRAARSDPVWAAALGRAMCFTIIVSLATVQPLPSRLRLRGRSRVPSRGDGLRLAFVGAIDGLAAVCFTIATRHGLLSVVALLGSLYPVTTVVLAHLLLRERLKLSQSLAVAALLAGVACAVVG